MEKIELANLFAKAARKDKFMTEEERQRNGARIFKKQILGRFGNRAVKTLDEMAQLLYDTGIVSSLKEGRELTPSIMGGRVIYGSGDIVFEEVRDEKGNIRYRTTDYNCEY